MKTRVALVVAACAAFIFSFSLSTAEEKEGFSAKCPVSGAAAKEDKTVDYKGKKVYFCCENCPKAFTKDPAKFAAKANQQLALTKQVVQVACPLSGEPVDKEKTVDVNGVKVAFCCEKCQGKADKAADKLALLFDDKTFDKAYTLQNKCPVSGKDIDVTKTVDYKGKKVYFCCGNCPKAFEKEPAKYEAKLPQLSEKK